MSKWQPALAASDALLSSLRQALQAGRGLSVFAGVVADDVGQKFLELLALLLGARQTETEDAALAARAGYSWLFARLAEGAELGSGPLVGDAWQHHLLDRLASDDNVLSRKLARAGLDQVGPALLVEARQDLRRLQALYRVHAQQLVEALNRQFGSASGGASWTPWDAFTPLHGGASPLPDPALPLKRQLAEADDWGEALDVLAQHYRTNGTGLFARYRAFRWLGRGRGGRLEGIARPDPVQLDELIGYEAEREMLIRNTEWFLEGYPANNILISGDRGTGKSSTIKALLNAYADRGLRLVEVSKHDLADFPALVSLLRDRRERFILFVDDLSFEQHETAYKELKAVLEGGLETRPANLVLYATSNRRHLVQERWAEREGADEVHAGDALQEKLSLADRFGIHLTFQAPDQARYLEIVAGLARRRQLPIAPAELRRRALQWAQWQNARSGRTARQFIDYLTAEQASSAR